MPDVALVGVLPFTMVGDPTAGTAGGMTIRPFTGEFASGFPCWLGGGPDGTGLPDTTEGGKAFVALA